MHVIIIDIAEEEKLLDDLVVTGTKLVAMIEEVVKNTDILISIAGNYNPFDACMD